MKASLARELKSLAKQLPEKVEKTGPKGKKVVVNHFKRLKKAYKSKSVKGVKEYCDSVMDSVIGE